MKLQRITLAALAFLLGVTAYAQREPEYDRVVVLQTRIDARDLGYAPLDVIPDGESGITSLTVAPSGDLYGATSGSRSHLFVLVPRHGYVQPLGVIPGATSVTHALVVSAAGDVYIGTSPEGRLLKYARNPLKIFRLASSCPSRTWASPWPGRAFLRWPSIVMQTLFTD